MVSVELGTLLARGGMFNSHSGGDSPDELGWSKYNGALDPGGAEQLGKGLTNGLLERRPTEVLVWEYAEDLVLAHVVARELGVTVVRAYDFDGLVRYVGSFGPSPRVVLLADAFRNAGVLRALRTLVAQQDGTVVAVAALVSTPEVVDDPMFQTISIEALVRSGDET